MIDAVFADALERSVSGDLSPIELLVAADRHATAGETECVIRLYRSWIEHNPGNPLLHAMYFNYAVVLSNAGDLAASRTALGQAIALKPDFMPPHINMGFVLERLGATGEAVTQWLGVAERLHAVDSDSVAHKTTALKQVGRVLEAAQFAPQAEDALRRSLEIGPGQRDVLQHWLSLRQSQCKWPVVAPWGGFTRTQLLAGMSPLSMAAHTDDPLLQLASAAAYAKAEAGRPEACRLDRYDRLPCDKGPLRIGYLSSDLREHAVGYLTAELFELHDRSAVEVFVYYCGHEVHDTLHARIRQAADHWRDIAAMTDAAAAATIAADRVAILVDLNGYTHGARTRMLALRPAPVIVNWLGFPATTGSAVHHYIIADDFIIPAAHEIFYSEQVVRLPCYQPNDRRRVVAAQTPSRREAGLPEDAMIYCCFNGTQKMTFFTWQRWMTILLQVEGSVLWLLDGIESVRTRLQDLAADHGVAPERLVFAPKLPNAAHLARYPLADLFLDTSPYGAHTTASDALWMGVPVLTLAGRSFAARVCGSLVTAAGLGELVCTTPDSFVALAVALGHDPARRATLRAKLRAGRDSCTLFDTPSLVANLEALYSGMWADARAGRTPRPDLANLDVYKEIGLELDRDDVECLTVTDFCDRYRDALAARDAYCLIRPDGRLWSDPPRPHGWDQLSAAAG